MPTADLVTKLRRLGFQLIYNDNGEMEHVVVPATEAGYSVVIIQWDDIVSISHDEWNTI